MGSNTVSGIVKEVYSSLWNKLHPLYMPEPTTDSLKNSAEEIFKKVELSKLCRSNRW